MAVVKGLRARGVDVITCQEAGTLSASDREQLKFATQAGRAIFTHDTDYLKLHSEGIEHAGIVYSPNQLDIGGNIRYLKLIHDVLDADDMANKVEFI